MAVIIILNIALAILVVGGILALLGWGIASDRVVAARLADRRRTLLAHRRQSAHRRAPGYRGAGAALHRGS